MSNVKVISIAKEHELILGFLYPNYTITDSASVVSNFITHRDIKSRREREALDLRYDNCVFISSQIFDEFYDEEVIKRECVSFAHRVMRSRKKNINITGDFIQDCIKFMFDLSTEEQEQSIFELFDSFGSVSFVKNFLTKSLVIPLPVLISSMNTFINKIMVGDSSIYYKRKQILFQEKINRNIIRATDSFILRGRDDLGLSQVKFYTDLYAD